MMKLIKYPSKEQWAELLEASGFEYGELVRYSSYYYK